MTRDDIKDLRQIAAETAQAVGMTLDNISQPGRKQPFASVRQDAIRAQRRAGYRASDIAWFWGLDVSTINSSIRASQQRAGS